MTISGIAVEFNTFQSEHKYLLDKAGLTDKYISEFRKGFSTNRQILFPQSFYPFLICYNRDEGDDKLLS